MEDRLFKHLLHQNIIYILFNVLIVHRRLFVEIFGDNAP